MKCSIQFRNIVLFRLNLLLLTSSQILPDIVFDGQTVAEAAPSPAPASKEQRVQSDLSQFLTSVALQEFTVIVARAEANDEGEAVNTPRITAPANNILTGYYEDLNGFLVTITRHNKIMQIFTTQTTDFKRSIQRPVAAPKDDKEISQVKTFSSPLVPDRFNSDLMGQFPTVATRSYYNTDNNNKKSNHFRSKLEKTSRLFSISPAELARKLFAQPVRPGRGIILIIDNLQQLPELYDILRQSMSTVKFVLFPMTSSTEHEEAEKEKEFIHRTIERFMQQLWKVDSIYYVFFISYCYSSPVKEKGEQQQQQRQNFLHSCTGETLFFNPYVVIRNSTQSDSSEQWGMLDKLPINCGLSNSLIYGSNNNENDLCPERPRNSSAKKQKSTPRDLIEYIDLLLSTGTRSWDFNGHSLRGIMFPATMIYLKNESLVLNKTLDHDKFHKLPFEQQFFGLDGTVAAEMARRLNFTLSVRNAQDDMAYGFQEPNGTFNGGLGDIAYRRADFTVNGYFIKDYFSRDVEFSTPSYSDQLCIIVRSADRIPDSLLIFKCFSVQVWLITAVTLVVVAVLYGILSSVAEPIELGMRIRGDPGTKELPWMVVRKGEAKSKRVAPNTIRTVSLFDGPGRIVAILLSAPVTRMGTTAFERCFIAVCMFWSLNLTGVFQGSLYDVYTNPKSYANIDTLGDLSQANIPIVVVHLGLIADVFGGDEPGNYLRGLRSKLIPSSMEDGLMGRVAREGKVAGLERYLNMPRIYQEYVRQDGSSFLYMVKECPRSYRLGYLLPSNSIYREPFNHYVGLFTQSGLTNKWMNDALFILQLEREQINRDHIEEKSNILTLRHLQTAFYILFMGNGISLGVFLGEVVKGKRK